MNGDLAVLFQLAVNGVVAGTLYIPSALGFALIYSTARFFHFAHGSVFLCALYAAFILSQRGVSFAIGPGLVLVMLLMAVVAALVGLLMELIVYRPLRALHATNEVLMVASVGLFILVNNSLVLAFGKDAKALSGAEIVGFNVGPLRLTGLSFATLVTGLICFVIVSQFLARTRAGKSLRAYGLNPRLAETLGLSGTRLVALSFIIGSALLGPAAVLAGLQQGVSPSVGLPFVLVAAIAMIVGGVGSVPGAAAGAILIGVVQNVGIWRASSQWQDALAFAVLFAFLIVRPRGFFGEKQRAVEV